MIDVSLSHATDSDRFFNSMEIAQQGRCRKRALAFYRLDRNGDAKVSAHPYVSTSPFICPRAIRAILGRFFQAPNAKVGRGGVGGPKSFPSFLSASRR
jgi:hypothetical protein